MKLSKIEDVTFRHIRQGAICWVVAERKIHPDFQGRSHIKPLNRVMWGSLEAEALVDLNNREEETNKEIKYAEKTSKLVKAFDDFRVASAEIERKLREEVQGEFTELQAGRTGSVAKQAPDGSLNWVPAGPQTGGPEQRGTTWVASMRTEDLRTWINKQDNRMVGGYCEAFSAGWNAGFSRGGPP